VTFTFVIIENKAITCSFTVSCFGIKFVGQGPKRWKSRCWFFGISLFESHEKASYFHFEDWVEPWWPKHH